VKHDYQGIEGLVSGWLSEVSRVNWFVTAVKKGIIGLLGQLTSVWRGFKMVRVLK